MRYSALKVFLHGVTARPWAPAFRRPDLREKYQVIIIGAGGHGLATAYYLAKYHGVKNIAVLDKGVFGQGNVGRNTTIVRSNYLLPANIKFYQKSLELWESLSQELNYNVMFSQRGVLNLAHSDPQMDAFARRGNAMRAHGTDVELLDARQVKKLVPNLEYKQNRFPIYGGLFQAKGGTARHDAVAWGYARAASDLGVDIIQNCEVIDFIKDGKKIKGVNTNRGVIYAEKVGLAVAGSTSILTSKLGMRLPLESHVLQAFVTESVKPILDTVVTYGAGHFYVSQSDKGSLVFGGNLDGYNSYAQRGNLPVMDEVISEGLALFPQFAKLRLLRSWGGIMDMSMDGSPIIDKTPYQNLYLNCGWCYGGFKATPASGYVFAYHIANGRAHELNAPFTLDRFAQGRVLDEKGVGAVPKLH